MNKITIITGATNRLLDVLIEKLSVNGVLVERIQQKNCSSKSRFFAWTEIFFNAHRDFLITILSKPEIVAYHYFGPRSLISALGFAIFRVPFVIHFWGSDYFYWRSRNNFLLRYICRKAKTVSFANSQMIEEAKNIFGEKIKFSLLRFGLEALDLIDDSLKTKDDNEIRIVVGTNSQVGQQHSKIIDALEETALDIPLNVLYIFPLNYGDPNNKEAVKERLRSSSINYLIIENYFLGNELAKFRNSTNILIQVQKTDAMSGAMLESLYSGAKIITGAWLPYNDLRELGIDWMEIKDISEISSKLPILIDSEIDFKKNKEIVSEISRWSNLIPLWINCYLN